MRPYIIKRLCADDAAAYRTVRLDGLQKDPTAFNSSWEEESAQPVTWFANRLENHVVLGGWLDKSTLLGVAGLFIPLPAKLRHKGSVAGVYVRPEFRGAGLAQALLSQLIDYARSRQLNTLWLTVEASNTAALELYKKLGFEQCGREPQALKINGIYYDEVSMVLPLMTPES